MLNPRVRDDLEYFDRVMEGEEVVVVHDPIRTTYFKFNVLQTAMLRALDGRRTPLDIAEELAQQYDVEIPREAIDKFIVRARELMLLDITAYSSTPPNARKYVQKALRKAGFQTRSPSASGTPRKLTPESTLFAEAFRQIDLGHPRAAAMYLTRILDKNPKNARAKELFDLIQRAYLRSAGGMHDFPTWVVMDPSRLLTWLSRKIGWFVFSPMGVVAIIAFLIVGAYAQALIDHEHLSIGGFDIVVIVVFILVSSFLHELGHGFACQHYGGNVTEIGFILFFNFKPTPYCDTSSSYMIESRRHKVIVQLAGVTMTMLVFSFVSILLAVLSPEVPIYSGFVYGIILSFAFNFVTLIPLLKVDGYYALSDGLGFPNLRERAGKLTRALFARLLLGLEMPTEKLPTRTRRWLITYGIAARLFTVCFVLFIFTHLIFAPVVEHFRGPGLVFCILFGFTVWKNLAVRPVWEGLKMIFRERRKIFTLRRTAMLMVLAGALVAPWFLQWPVLVDSGFVLVPRERAEVRAQTPGRVREVLVKEGDLVRAGQPIAMLGNAQLRARIAVLEAERTIATHRLADVRAGARTEQVALAQARVETARSAVYERARKATIASRLATAKLGTQDTADHAHQDVASVVREAGVAGGDLAILKAGPRAEEVKVAEAEYARIDGQLEHLKKEEALLVLRSPIDGVVVTPRLADKLQMMLKAGDLFTEVHDVGAMIAELQLSPRDPLSDLKIGDKVVLKPHADPDIEVETRVERFRQTVQKNEDGDDGVIVVTAPFQLERRVSGLKGHARIYGDKHTLAYATFWLPIERVVKVQLWSMW